MTAKKERRQIQETSTLFCCYKITMKNSGMLFIYKTKQNIFFLNSGDLDIQI